MTSSEACWHPSGNKLIECINIQPFINHRPTIKLQNHRRNPDTLTKSEEEKEESSN